MLFAVPAQLRTPEARAGAAPLVPMAPEDPLAHSQIIEQGPMVHVFDTTSLEGGPYYVNDHSLVQARDGSWHLFGIFHREPMAPDDSETELVHAVNGERDPARWAEHPFDVAPPPNRIALRADRSVGETHLWAPHVIAVDGRYVMAYQAGGRDDDHASIRLAESDDLYRWTRVGKLLFEDFCEARDPMLSDLRELVSRDSRDLERRDASWALYYTRCEALTHKVSGVAYRVSRDLVHWSDARMIFTAPGAEATSNSAYTESPFVFERGGNHYLSVTAYPVAWDATFVYRSPAPFAFAEAPFTRLRAHAAEWVFAPGGRGTWLTHAGPGQRGVWMSTIDGL